MGQDIISGLAVFVISTVILYATRKITKTLKDSKHECEWHRQNTNRLMLTQDAVLDFIEREARDRGFKLNGRFARARENVDEYIKEIERSA